MDGTAVDVVFEVWKSKRGESAQMSRGIFDRRRRPDGSEKFWGNVVRVLGIRQIQM